MRVCIEGLIGCGKSSLLHELQKSHHVIQEPVDDWQHLLELFYENQQRWALTLNSCALLSFADIPKKGLVVVERSPLSCKEVFSRMHKNEGVMSDKEWQLLSDLYDHVGWQPDVIIYLKCPVSTCLDRIQQRSRDGEDMITHEYLSKLQFAHQTMLRYFNGELHVVDSSRDAMAVAARVKDILKAYSLQ